MRIVAQVARCIEDVIVASDAATQEEAHDAAAVIAAQLQKAGLLNPDAPPVPDGWTAVDHDDLARVRIRHDATHFTLCPVHHLSAALDVDGRTVHVDTTGALRWLIARADRR